MADVNDEIRNIAILLQDSSSSNPDEMNEVIEQASRRLWSMLPPRNRAKPPKDLLSEERMKQLLRDVQELHPDTSKIKLFCETGQGDPFYQEIEDVPPFVSERGDGLGEIYVVKNGESGHRVVITADRYRRMKEEVDRLVANQIPPCERCGATVDDRDSGLCSECEKGLEMVGDGAHSVGGED